MQADLGGGTGSVAYLTDHLGSTSQLLDSLNASDKGRYDYQAYGKLEGDASTSALSNRTLTNPYLYTGRELDPNGLYYYRARYYDPELEVFLSQDPLGDAQRYVGGNPIAFVDPLGLAEYLQIIMGNVLPDGIEGFIDQTSANTRSGAIPLVNDIATVTALSAEDIAAAIKKYRPTKGLILHGHANSNVIGYIDKTSLLT